MIEKKEFPTPQALAQQVVAQNYHLYPELNGLTERLKETVHLYSYRSSRNPSSIVARTKIVF